MKGWKDSPFTHLALQKAGGSSFQFVPRQCAADNCVERGSQACKTKMCAKCCRKNPSGCSTHAPKKKAKVAASSSATPASSSDTNVAASSPAGGKRKAPAPSKQNKKAKVASSEKDASSSSAGGQHE